MDALAVAVTRGGIRESLHRVHVAVADARGRIRASAGDPYLITFLRSSAKPLQALPLVESGAADAFGLGESELAIACASHAGGAVHTAAATALLRKAGLTPAALRCGIHAPEDREAAEALAGQAPVRLHNNCSGKHAGMLAVCVHRGWDPATYLDPEHPLQAEIRALVTAVAGATPVIGTDGCGVPTFGLPLAAMATAFARLGSGETLPAGRAAAAVRLAAAMAAHPELVSGPGHFNTEFLRRHGAAWMLKGGAEGLWCGALRGPGGLGLAVKAEDGSGRGSTPAFLAVLEALGLPGGSDPALADHRRPVVRNTLGAAVGWVEVVSPPAWPPLRLQEGMVGGA